MRKISVVMTTTSASAVLMSTSPVFNPTLRTPKSAWNSRSFWLDRALSGVVYMAFCPRASAVMMAVSPTRVLPDPVGADTTTLSPRSSAVVASLWKPSSGKSYTAAMSSDVTASPVSLGNRARKASSAGSPSLAAESGDVWWSINSISEASSSSEPSTVDSFVSALVIVTDDGILRPDTRRALRRPERRSPVTHPPPPDLLVGPAFWAPGTHSTCPARARLPSAVDAIAPYRVRLSSRGNRLESLANRTTRCIEWRAERDVCA